MGEGGRWVETYLTAPIFYCQMLLALFPTIQFLQKLNSQKAWEQGYTPTTKD